MSDFITGKLMSRLCKVKFESTYLKRDSDNNLIINENGNYIEETYTSEISNLNDDGTINPSALRVDFNIYKYFTAVSSRGKISIKNCNKEISTLITLADYTQITLYLGYKENGFNQVFTGEVVTSLLKKDSRNTNTINLTVIQNQGFQTFSYITQTFRKGTTYYDIIDYISKNGSLPKTLKLPEELKNYVTNKSYTIDGNASSTIAELSSLAGMSYSVDDLEIKSITRTLEEGTEIPYLTSNSGLVDFPKLTNSGIQFTCLINPNIQIANYVKINNTDISEEYSGDPFPNRQLGAWLDNYGIYYIVSITIKGNNKEGDFYYECNSLSRQYIPTLFNTLLS